MFLIQITETSFINADKIECVYFDKTTGLLCVQTEKMTDDCYLVQDEFTSLFLNHLGGVDHGIGQVADKLGELLKGNK